MKSSMPSTTSSYRASYRASYFALIPAAGVGARMQADGPKQYLPIGGAPMLAHTIKAFLACDAIAHTFVVVSPDDGKIDAVVAPLGAGVSVLRCGGATRMDSILNGLQAIAERVRDDDWILVHDAARPGLTAALIEQLIGATGAHPVGGLLALPVVLMAREAIRQPSAALSPFACAITLILAVNLVDLLPNDTLIPFTWLMAGAVLGHAEALRATWKVGHPRPVAQLQPGRTVL